MAKKDCPECPKCLPGWLVQFGDLMSLLLTFFILLLSMAVMDKKKVEEYFEIMKKSMGFMSTTNDTDAREEETNDIEKTGQEAGEDSSISESITSMEQVVQSVNDNMSLENQQITIDKGKNEFTLDIPSTVVFNEGEYKLNNNAKKFIAKVARVIRTMPQTYNIEVIGHTDTNRVKNSTIPRDSWDLSALRSISVVKELIKYRIDPRTLKVSAYASYHPKSDISTDNRRVELRFYSSNNSSDILDDESFFDKLEE